MVKNVGKRWGQLACHHYRPAKAICKSASELRTLSQLIALYGKPDKLFESNSENPSVKNWVYFGRNGGCLVSVSDELITRSHFVPRAD